MRKLSDDQPGLGVDQVEPHEPVAVVLGDAVRREKQIPGGRRDARDDRILVEERTALRDLDSFVHIDARIPAADHVLRGREEAPRSQREENNRKEERQGRPPRRRPQPQVQSRDRSHKCGDGHVDDEQALEGVAPQVREGHRGGERNAQAHHHGPEEPFLGVEAGAPIARGNRSAEDCGPRQPRHDREL
jgi:hypothetical protein